MSANIGCLLKITINYRNFRRYTSKKTTCGAKVAYFYAKISLNVYVS